MCFSTIDPYENFENNIMMKLVCAIVFLAGICTLNGAFGNVIMKRVSIDQMLMQELMHPRAGNPQYSAQCFSIHIPILQGIISTYSTSYQLCTTIANEQLALLSEEAKGNKTEINKCAQDICSSMSSCSALDNTLDFLDCYSRVGDTNVRTMYTLTANASEVADKLREQYLLITNVMERCQHAAERSYVESTAAATDSLNECLENGPKPSTVAPTTEENSTTPIASTTEDIPTTESDSTEEDSSEEWVVEEEDLSG